MNMKRITSIVSVCALAAALCACAAETPGGKAPIAPGTQPNSTTMVHEGNTADCSPLTGLAYAEGQTNETRPVAVMVDNSMAAYPQRGIGSADVIYEMVTEGGITRLMAVYPTIGAVPSTGVGPVRSARDQFVQLMLPTNALFVHIGSSIYARNLLNEYSYQDIDGMFLGKLAFLFDTAREAQYGNEHCWFTTGELVQAGLEHYSLSSTGNVPMLFRFSQNKVTPQGEDATDIQFHYSEKYNVGFTYDSAAGVYRKSSFGQPHIDSTTGEALQFTNVFILFTEITLKPDGNCTEFNFQTGTGLYISNGKCQTIRWRKGDATENLVLLDADGSELAVNTGKSYVGFVADNEAENIQLSPHTADDSSSLAE